MRVLFLALVLTPPVGAAAAGCGSATIGGPLDDDDVTDAADDQDPIDARVIVDAPPPDARLCTGGERRVEDPQTGHCLTYFATPATWQDARATCLGLGGELAAVNSQAENALLLPLPTEVVVEPDVWLGAHDGTVEGTFVWISGDAMTYTNWRSGEPNNGGVDGTPEDCAVMEADTATGTWDDRPCASTFPYFCERL